MKFKCNNCKKIDSIHVKDTSTSILAMAYGPKDLDGRQQYYIYCKDCKVVNVYKPYLLGFKKKFDRFVDNIPLLINELSLMNGNEAAPVPIVVVKGLARELVELLNQEQQTKKPKQPQNHYKIGLKSSSGEEGNIIVETGYMPNFIITKAGIGHYEFCLIANNMLKYSQRLNFTTIRVYTGLNEAAAAMAAEVARLESVGYKTEVNTPSNAHNMELINSELALKKEKPMVKKVTGDVCVEAGYKPFVTVQVFEGMDAQYIYLVNNTFIMYEIGKYNTSHIHTYKSQELASQGLADYLVHTKSQGFTNIIHPENNIHNAMVENGRSV